MQESPREHWRWNKEFRNKEVCHAPGSGLVFPRGPRRSTSSSPSFPSFQCFSVHFPHLCFLHLQLVPSLDLSVFKPSCFILSSSVRSCVHPVSPPPAFFFCSSCFYQFVLCFVLLLLVQTLCVFWILQLVFCSSSCVICFCNRVSKRSKLLIWQNKTNSAHLHEETFVNTLKTYYVDYIKGY